MVRVAGLEPLVTALGGGETTRLIGGVVRDSLLDVPVSDIDLATQLRPNEVMTQLDTAGIKCVPTGLAHGTVTAVLPIGPVEITTLRRDVATDGRHATVAFTNDWHEDAARRDFTINALSADPDTGEIFDYFGGQNDLIAGHVRFIGEPLQRIAEDHLRILRFFRFFARFGKGDPDTAAIDACAARANDLMALSRERIATELLKLLAATDPVPAVRLMLKHGIFKPVLPEITSANKLTALVSHEGTAGDPVRRLAALMGPNPTLAWDVAARLKLSKAHSKRLVAACGWTEPYGTPNALAYRIGEEGARDRLLLAGIDPSPLDKWVRPYFPISGGTLIARGMPPGPQVAKTLAAIENAWIDKGFPEGPAFDALLAGFSPVTPLQS
jgi:poly(A) polymerase